MWQTDKRKGRQARMVNTILIYIHLAVVFGVGILLCNAETQWIKAFGALNMFVALATAYIYALYHLWVVLC